MNLAPEWNTDNPTEPGRYLVATQGQIGVYCWNGRDWLDYAGAGTIGPHSLDPHCVMGWKRLPDPPETIATETPKMTRSD
jgi:hypothetical protein